MKVSKGFTLVELLIALFVGALMMTAVYGVVNMAQKSSSGIERRVVSQKDVRGALDLMALELRMASYNPQPEDKSIWKNAVNCTAAGTSAYKGIQAATASSITIEMDANDSQVINDFANEIITYNYDTATQSITRAANCGTVQTFIGGTIVKIVNNSAGVAVFRYFDFNNVEIPAANLPARIPDIRVIEIALVAETEDKDPLTNNYRRIVYSTRVIPRNHGANP